MAYNEGDFAFRVTGDLPGGEIWSNSWAVNGIDTGAAFDSVVDALHDFYSTLAAARLVNDWRATRCVGRNLQADLDNEGTWATITGGDTNDPLPNQVGLRVSLTASGGVRGGPRLCGISSNQLTPTGTADDDLVQAVVDALETMSTAIEAAAGGLCIQTKHNTVNEGLVSVQSAKVGKRWDIQRSRANEVVEGYVSATV